MTEKSAKPQLRFAGFDDTWEQRKLGEVLISLQNNTLSRADLSSEKGIAKNIHYGDILVKFGEVIDVKTESLPMIADETVIAKYKSSFLQNGDVIVADTAEDETVGKCTEIAGLSDEIVISGLHTIPYRPLQKYAPGYLGYYMNSASFHNQLLPLMQGIKVTSISKTALQNIDILYPKSATEQAAIGKYFRNLDNLITLHQRKYDKLTNVKKSMLEKMFPKNGSNVPEIRFKGFSDAWEQRKLGDIMNVTSVKRIHQSDWTDSGIRFLRARDIVSASKNEEPDDYLYISKEKYDEYSLVSGKVTIGDLLVTGVGTIGVPYLIRNSEPLYFKDGNIIWFQNGTKIDGDFFLYSFFGKAIQDFINESAGIGTVGTYTIESGKKTPISLPEIKEQQQIGAYFRTLDNLITLHQRELEKLKNLKKACLEKMFV